MWPEVFCELRLSKDLTHTFRVMRWSLIWSFPSMSDIVTDFRCYPTYIISQCSTYCTLYTHALIRFILLILMCLWAPCFCKQTIIRSSGIGRESFISNRVIISTQACDCRRKLTWAAFKFLWSCLFCSPWKLTISTSPLWCEVNSPHKYVST